MQKTIKIAGVGVSPGDRKTVKIPIAPLYTHSEMTLPVHVICGRKAGPRLFVSAAIHGDELIGVEIIRRLMQLKKLARLRGTLIAVPVVNVYGFIQQSRYLPDRRDLNRFFPGSEKGSLTSQLADIFMEEIVCGSTHGIDLHAGSNHRTNLPQVRACLDDPETRRLAMAFKAPVVMDARLRDGSLRQAVADMGIPMLLYEAGEALRFDELAIRAGIRGIVGVMEAIGMLPPGRKKTSGIEPLVAESTAWVRAPASGIFRTKVQLGARIIKKSKLGQIADPFGDPDTDVLATTTGMVIGCLNLPLVHQGDALFHIAQFKEAAAIEPTLEEFREELNGSESV
jgi:predicted deacylase